MPKIIGANLAEHRQNTRNRLFESLSELMEHTGFESLTMSQIARNAGVGRTAVYNHFADKESLLLAFIEHETAQYAQNVSRTIRQTADPLEQLQIYLDEQFKLRAHYHLPAGRNLREIVSTETSADLRSHVAMVERILTRILRTAIAQKRIPEQDIPTVINLIHACLNGVRMPAEPAARGATISTVEIFIMRALGADPKVVTQLVKYPATRTAFPAAGSGLPREGVARDKPASGAGSPLGSRCPVHH